MADEPTLEERRAEARAVPPTFVVYEVGEHRIVFEPKSGNPHCQAHGFTCIPGMSESERDTVEAVRPS